MSEEIITVHSLEFIIDTMDWSDHRAAEVASNAMEMAIRNLSASDAARVWVALKNQMEDESADQDALAMVDRIQSAAFNEAVEGWADHPELGHNCSIAPVLA